MVGTEVVKSTENGTTVGSGIGLIACPSADESGCCAKEEGS